MQAYILASPDGATTQSRWARAPFLNSFFLIGGALGLIPLLVSNNCDLSVSELIRVCTQVFDGIEIYISRKTWRTYQSVNSLLLTLAATYTPGAPIVPSDQAQAISGFAAMFAVLEESVK